MGNQFTAVYLSIKKFMLLHSELFLFNCFHSVEASMAEN